MASATRSAKVSSSACVHPRKSMLSGPPNVFKADLFRQPLSQRFTKGYRRFTLLGRAKRKTPKKTHTPHISASVKVSPVRNGPPLKWPSRARSTGCSCAAARAATGNAQCLRTACARNRSGRQSVTPWLVEINARSLSSSSPRKRSHSLTRAASSVVAPNNSLRSAFWARALAASSCSRRGVGRAAATRPRGQRSWGLGAGRPSSGCCSGGGQGTPAM
mmetsp:Transcript_105784/g.336900  ORF Transcript_105784/g.336900 Transcript_105784/m.336900 type:complete len:218 (-) Transcript_105784:11-664(-)